MVKTLPLFEALKTVSFSDLDRNLFSSPGWLRVLDKTYRLQLFIKYIERDGQVASYIIYSVVKNFLEWKICLCSYCDYCDGRVQTLADWQDFFLSLRKDFPQYRIAVRNLRDEVGRQFPEFKVLSQEKFHILDVRENVEKIWKKTHDSFRSAVKQSEKGGVIVKRCPQSELRKFYELHLQVRKNKYRVFPQPYRFFEAVWNEYMTQDKGVLLGAYDEKGEFIGGNVYLICGNTLYYKFNTSSLKNLKRRPNNLLFWEGMKFAKERGLEFIDLGSSGLHQDGLILFKDHTGAQSLFITHLGYHPPNYKFSQKRILSLMTKTFTNPWVPNQVVEWGSSLIYPYLA